MGFKESHARRRKHFMRPKKGELICTMSAQGAHIQGSGGVQFNEEQEEWDQKWTKNEVTYSLIKDSKDIPGSALENIAVYGAMQMWEMEIPLKLRITESDKNPDIKIEFADSSNESYFFNNKQVLGIGYYPGGSKQGVVKLNDDFRWSINGKSIGFTKTYNIFHTMLHEIGHSLGLTHATGLKSSNSVMNPFYNNNNLEPSPYDVSRIQKKYGKLNLSTSEHDKYKTHLKNSLKKLGVF